MTSPIAAVRSLPRFAQILETRMNKEAVINAAMESLQRHGVPVFRSDMPGLFMSPVTPELTEHQLVDLACQRDPTFDPGRYK